jgi:hypothetical protein
MPRSGDLGCLDKRDLLNQSAVSIDALVMWGRSFEEEDLIYDAIDFYDKANAKDDLKRLLDKAVEEGNVFLFKRLCRVVGKEATSDQWLSLARRAEELGLDAFAAEAYRQTEDQGATPRSE